MDEDQLQAQKEEQDELVYIFNPTKDDFTTSYDIEGDFRPTFFTVRAREGIKIQRFLADHIAKKLKDEIMGNMNDISRSKDIVEEEIYKTIKFYD